MTFDPSVQGNMSVGDIGKHGFNSESLCGFCYAKINVDLTSFITDKCICCEKEMILHPKCAKIICNIKKGNDVVMTKEVYKSIEHARLHCHGCRQNECFFCQRNGLLEKGKTGLSSRIEI